MEISRYLRFACLFTVSILAGCGGTYVSPTVGPKAAGLDVLGPVDHGIFDSIYFFDPNGHRLELAADKGTDAEMAALKAVADDMLEEWSRTRKAPQHAAWLHDPELPRPQ